MKYKNKTMGLYIANVDKIKNNDYYNKIINQNKFFNKKFKTIIICKSPNYSFILRYLFFYKNIIKFFIKFKNNLRFIYIRHPRHNFIFLFLLFFFKAQKKSLIIIEELPTFPLELLKIKFFLNIKVLNLNQHFLRVFSNYFIDHYSAIGNKGIFFKKKVINIFNGIDDTKIKKKKLNKIVNFLFIGNLSKRHGFDRFLNSLRKIKSKKLKNKLNIFIVGTLSFSEKIIIQKQLDDIQIKHKFYGYLEGKKLQKVLAKAHYGIGNLGFYRFNVNFTSALKERMYLKNGIPFIYAGKDYSLEKIREIALKVSNNSNDIQFKKIMKHLMRFYSFSNSNIREIRDKINTHCSWDESMKNLDKYF